MRFVIFSGESNYGALRLHVEQLAQAMRKAGHEVFVVDFLSGKSAEVMAQAATARIDAFLSFNGVGHEAAIGGQSLFDFFDSYFVALLVDHPAHHWGRLATPINRYIVCSLDCGHIDFISQYVGNEKFSAMSVVPPGANYRLALQNSDFDDWAARPIEVLFTGSIQHQPERNWQGYGDHALVRLLNEVVDGVLEGEFASVDEAFLRGLQERQIVLSKKHQEWLAVNTVIAHGFVESTRRISLVNLFDQAGISVLSYGNGWEPVQESCRNLQWQGVGSFEQTLQILPQTKIVINTNNHFHRGAHERVFAAQAGGAAVLTDMSEYYLDEFQDGKDILFYRWSSLEDAPRRLAQALADPVGTAALARAGWEKTMTRHTWDARAKQLVDLLQLTQACSQGS